MIKYIGYEISPGETIHDIAQKFNTTVDVLYRLNSNRDYSNVIYVPIVFADNDRNIFPKFEGCKYKGEWFPHDSVIIKTDHTCIRCINGQWGDEFVMCP